MKKSKLRKIIREIIKEQTITSSNPYEAENVFFDPNVFQCPEGQVTNMETMNGLCENPQTWYETIENMFGLAGGGFPNADNIFLTQCCTESTEVSSFNASCPAGSSVIQAGEVPEVAGTFNEFGFSTVTMPNGVPSYYADRCSTFETWYNHYENVGAIPGPADGGPNTFSMSSTTVEPVDQAYIARCCVMSDTSQAQAMPTAPQAQAMPTTLPSPKKRKRDPQRDRMQKLANISKRRKK